MRYNLIIDGDFYFRRSLYKCMRDFSSKGKFLSDTDSKDAYVKKVLCDISYMCNMFKSHLRSLTITRDSKSWRKEIYPEYKAKRIKDDKIDWDAYRMLQNDIENILVKKNATRIKIDGLEGDDIIYGLSKKFVPNIIVTSDMDMVQLLDENNFIYLPIKKTLLVDKNVQTEYVHEKISIFDESFLNTRQTNIHESLFDMLRSNDIEIKKVDVNYQLMSKVMMGDTGDNIKPIKRGLGPVSFDTIYNALETKDMESFMSVMVEKHGNSVIESYDMNRTLIVLDTNHLPFYLTGALDALPESLHSFNQSQLELISGWPKILEGTKYDIAQDDDKEYDKYFGKGNILNL